MKMYRARPMTMREYRKHLESRGVDAATIARLLVLHRRQLPDRKKRDAR